MTIRLAVPNKGRLADPAVTLLKSAGLSFERTDRALGVPIWNADLELLFVRTEDVFEMVEDGVAHLGITGQDLLADGAAELPVLADLGFGRCRLVAAVPSNAEVDKVEDFAGLRIATSHRRATEKFFAGHQVDVSIVELRGSVEVAPKLGIADAIVDLVSSGSTMLINGLRPVVTLLESQAVLIGSDSAAVDIAAGVQQVTTMLRAVVAGRRKRYLLMNVPLEAKPGVEALIPGLESPTEIPLAEPGMVAIHSVVDTDEVWSLVPRLKEAGARGILVLPISQLVP